MVGQKKSNLRRPDRSCCFWSMGIFEMWITRFKHVPWLGVWSYLGAGFKRLKFSIRNLNFWNKPLDMNPTLARLAKIQLAPAFLWYHSPEFSPSKGGVLEGSFHKTLRWSAKAEPYSRGVGEFPGSPTIQPTIFYSNLEPKWPLLLKVNPPNTGPFSNQNNGHQRVTGRFIIIQKVSHHVLKTGRLCLHTPANHNFSEFTWKRQAARIWEMNLTFWATRWFITSPQMIHKLKGWFKSRDYCTLLYNWILSA